MHFFRDIGRRPVRTGLTILGITIGIWALVVFGSMASKISALVEGGSAYYEDVIQVTDAAGGAGGFSSVPMSILAADEVRAVAGVDVVAPAVMMLLDAQPAAISMGVPPMVSGTVAGSDAGRDTFSERVAEGRALTSEDEGERVTVLGSDIARKHAKRVGDTITLRGWEFTVVGILEPTLTAPDQVASVPLHAAQVLFHESLPPVMRNQVEPSNLITTMTVYPAPGEDVETLADRIEAQVPGLGTMTGKDFDEQIGSAMSILNSILVGIALISLVVGGLSVVNTMAMSVAERTREIGIKRAIGGSRARIVRELVAEAAFIGFVGGVVGLGLGALVVVLANEAGRSSGTVLFQLTPGTAVSAILFSTILGAVAGFVPALHAARLDPVAALRYE